MKLIRLKQWISVLAVAIVTLAVACNSYDKDLIQLSDSIMALPEPRDFTSDFDRKWELSRQKHVLLRAELESLFTSNQPPTLETIEVEMAKIKEIIELDLEYINGAKGLYLNKIATKDRAIKVALHVELMRNVLLRIIYAYSTSAMSLKESDDMDSRFMVENRIINSAEAAKSLINRISLALHNLGFSPDFERSTRDSITNALVEDLKVVGISLDKTELAKDLREKQLRAKWANRPRESSPYTVCNTFSNGLNFLEANQDPSTSADKVIESCYRKRGTKNEECRENLSCENGLVYSDLISCTAFTSTVSFTRRHPNESVAKDRAYNDCMQYYDAKYVECRNKIKCEK